MNNDLHGISVLMPTYNQGAFISRAIASLQLQTFQNWELVIINDGSSDYTAEVVKDYLKDERIRYYENAQNKGLGVCLNMGLDRSNYNLIAYLPSDDIYFADHLASLYKTIRSDKGTILAYAGVQYNYEDNPTASAAESATGKIAGYSLQLVQVLHRKTLNRWIEREELVTDSLDRMFWDKLFEQGKQINTKKISCEWVSHPEQRHKIIQETSGGGIYTYKQYYQVKQPLIYHSTKGNYINELNSYTRFRQSAKKIPGKLKILLVGELAYNPERICALEEQGHQLYGLWMSSPDCYNTTGPLPFGNVIDLSLDTWVEAVKEIKPNIIYALLNHQAVPFAHYIMLTNPGIPFVWHFKEGPFYCRQNGTWKELMELYVNSDGQIYTNPEIKKWFGQFIAQEEQLTLILDGDLPKADWFDGKPSRLLSADDGQIHTVVPGRPLGLYPSDVKELALQGVHLHIYGDIQQVYWGGWIAQANALAPGYIHSHPHCNPDQWISEFPKYDAGWLHIFNCGNQGEMMKASWLELNYPARMTTLAAAGLPMIQKDNSGHIAATQSLINDLDMGIFFRSMDELGEKLKDKHRMQEIRNNAIKNKMFFSFDNHVDELIAFFEKVIQKKKGNIQFQPNDSTTTSIIA